MSTLAYMGKKKPASGRHKQPVLGLRLSGRLVNQVRELAKRTRRTLTAEVTIALEEYLTKNGLWPPGQSP